MRLSAASVEKLSREVLPYIIEMYDSLLCTLLFPNVNHHLYVWS